MSDSKSPSLFDISGFVFGLLGLAGTVQILCVIIFYYFPKRRLRGLERTYAEAYFLYRCGVQEGVLDSDRERIEEKLQRSRAELNEVHSEVFCLGGFWGQVFAIFGGLSQQFRDSDIAMKELCVVILSSSEKGRRELEKSGRVYKPCILPMMSSALGPLDSTMVEPTHSTKNLPRSHSHSQPCGFTPHQTHNAEPSFQPISPSHSTFGSANSKRSPTHRDSLCSVSTASTAVDINSTIPKATTIIKPERLLYSGEPNCQLVPQPEKAPCLGVSQSLPTHHEGTTSSALTIEDRYNNIQYLMELLLSNLHHLSALRQQPEERDISDEPSKLDSCLSKLQHPWTRSSRPPILPL
ncbi:hypothetical protein QCA50_004815 [Cerrena zonata]|uniref:Uncharacterized protein n=1 Tax=Cerrena zonata TaxID=2478898 RepID=A0AAW0GDG3_9APHY